MSLAIYVLIWTAFVLAGVCALINMSGSHPREDDGQDGAPEGDLTWRNLR